MNAKRRVQQGKEKGICGGMSTQSRPDREAWSRDPYKPDSRVHRQNRNRRDEN